MLCRRFLPAARAFNVCQRALRTAAAVAPATTMSSFADLRVPPHLVHRIKGLGATQPSLVQRSVMPALADGHDCVIHSPTGSGKTIAFLLPALARLTFGDSSNRGCSSSSGPQLVLVVPTRELCIQVCGLFEHL